MNRCLLYPRFNIIVATDSNGGFSYNNKLPWKFVKDSNFYNIITSSNVNHEPNILIMGRKTWESMNYSIPKNRLVFVITSQCDYYTNKYKENNEKNKKYISSIFFFPSFEESLKAASNYTSSMVWVVGGYQIYDEALRHENCGSIYLTQINGSFKTDRKIELNTYNITWSNVHTEVDVNCYDELNYILYFKKGFISRH